MWLVRVQRPLLGTESLDSLSPALGFTPQHAELLARVKSLPRAQLGLSLDRHLRIVADRTGQGRRGTVVRCGGDPVQSKLHLMACLALEQERRPEIVIAATDQPVDPGAVPTTDAGTIQTSDAGAVPAADASLTGGRRARLNDLRRGAPADAGPRQRSDVGRQTDPR